MRRVAVIRTMLFDTDNALKVRPVMYFLKPIGIVCRITAADFDTAMAFIGIFVRGQTSSCGRVFEEQTDILV